MELATPDLIDTPEVMSPEATDAGSDLNVEGNVNGNFTGKMVAIIWIGTWAFFDKRLKFLFVFVGKVVCLCSDHDCGMLLSLLFTDFLFFARDDEIEKDFGGSIFRWFSLNVTGLGETLGKPTLSPYSAKSIFLPLFENGASLIQSYFYSLA